MDPRSTAHVLAQIADLLELRGENRFKSRAYRTAARAVLALPGDDLRPLLRSGELAAVAGIGPATLGVIGELVERGESPYLERLRAETPEGLQELTRVPGLSTAKVHALHEALGLTSVEELERAAHDGRLSSVKGFGPKTAERILKGIAQLHATGGYVLYPRAAAEAAILLESVRSHPGVARAEVAGSVRRRREIVRDVDIVAACALPEEVAASIARLPAVRTATHVGRGSVAIVFVDGARLDLHCVTPPSFAVALWRATGSDAHVREVTARARSRGLALEGDALVAGDGVPLALPDEARLYAALGMQYVEPELREGMGEVEAAARGTLPRLLEERDIRGVLHCHSTFSDGKASIAEMAQAARERGWEYIGISDHSQAAFYAGGLTPERVVQQHAEIDRVNEAMHPFRVLKGVEADILDDGALDYGPDVLDRFDFVIGSVHSRFAMDEARMTARVLRALDDPRLTILGHPTGRLLLAREPYALDVPAVLERAAERGVAVELNADPHRLDLDWRNCHLARERGVTVEIGPDAHSTRGLDYTSIGVGIARKGWLGADDVLNTRSAEEVMELASRRRAERSSGRGAPRRGGH